MKTPHHETQATSCIRIATRNSMIALFSGITLSQAEIIEFDLSPPGKDAAVGLSPANEVPPATGTGSGNEISGGISFDTSTSTLSIAMGYGSSAGFTDLTGTPTVMHIHGPAAAGTNTGVLFNLAPLHFPNAANAAKGGVFYGSIVYPPERVAGLLAGLNYVNIHTVANGGGEIRGQLIPLLNEAPEVTCPADATVECGDLFTYEATVSDADGDAVSVVWTLNGDEVKTEEIAAGGPPATAMVEFTEKLPLGVNTLTVTATDSQGDSSSCTATITVEDTTPPVIVSASVTPKVLSPPNHKMIPVRVSAEVADACGETTWKIISIASSEAVDAIGSGQTAPDRAITGDDTALLRAERSGKNRAGRIYTLTLQATDGSGNESATTTVTVTVPHSAR